MENIPKTKWYSFAIFVLISLAFLSNVPSVNGVKVTQQILGSDKGIIIEYPQYEYVKQNTYFKLHTHIFNSTNGLPLNNESHTCFIHLYNHTGDHILEEYMGFDSNGVDFQLYIGAGNFSINDQYAYILTCNNSHYGGAVSGLFEVTETGEEFTQPNATSKVAAVILTVFVLFFFILLAFILPNEHTLLKMILLFLSMATLMFAPSILIVQDAKYISLLNIGMWTFRIFVIYFVGYIFYYWIKTNENILAVFKNR